MKIGVITGVVVAVLAGGAGSACNFSHKKFRDEGLDLSQTDLSYATVNARVFSRQCTACHNSASAKAGVVLDRYEFVKANLPGIEKAALIDQSMPPSHPLSAGNQELLRAWIRAGAPLEGTTLPPPPPQVVEAKFSSIRSLIFEAKCISCHAVGEQAEKVPLMDYQDLIDSPRELVLPGNSEESGLTLSIERTDDKQMPPPESGIGHLTDAEIQAVKTWITDGAKND